MEKVKVFPVHPKNGQLRNDLMKLCPKLAEQVAVMSDQKVQEIALRIADRTDNVSSAVEMEYEALKHFLVSRGKDALWLSEASVAQYMTEAMATLGVESTEKLYARCIAEQIAEWAEEEIRKAVP